MLKHLRERHQDEKGFTLIELMVVVLIMGILMAIAIPTFLSTRGSANDASAKSNATNAYTNEKSYYAANQVFLGVTSLNSGGNTLDNSLPWGNTGNGVVAAYTASGSALTVGACTSGTECTVVIEASSASGHCFYIWDQETTSTATIAYNATTATCTWAFPTSGNTPTAAPATGSSAGVTNSVTGSTWYASW